jgi:intein-encoded DNA endonuclease-like protein
MNSESATNVRYFVSYSGAKLPLKLVNEITEASLNNRNTYYRGYFDAEDKMLLCQKVVYGEVESEHQYQYDDSGVLAHAQITEDDEMREIHFNAQGERV